MAMATLQGIQVMSVEAPMDQEVIQYASERFKLIEHSSGRLDYVETNRRWTALYKKFSFKKYWFFLRMLPKYLSDKEFRHVASFLKYAPNRRCFERELFDHFRYVFERVK